MQAKRMLTLGTVVVTIAANGVLAAPTEEAGGRTFGAAVQSVDSVGVLMAEPEGGEGEAGEELLKPEAEGEGDEAAAREGEGHEAEAAAARMELDALEAE